MIKHLVISVLFLMAAIFSTAYARPYDIAIPAFSITQSTNPQAANFADKLASLLARKSGYTIYRAAELSSRITPRVLANINIEDLKTLAEAGVSAGCGRGQPLL